MMKKRWLLLCLLLLLSGCTQQSVEKMPEEPPVTVGESTSGTPMPENEAEQPALSADLEELNRVHTPALYAMGGYGSWDDSTVMKPDSFVDYYQYLLSAQPELEEDAGIYTDEDKLRRMVPQESLEQLVCPRFGVSEERVRESSFYDAGEEAYELTGIGSAWSCQILSAEQQGEELRMQFVMLDSHDLPMSHGTLTAERADDGFRYRSMEREDYPSFQLEYPMAYDGTYSDGRFLWDTSAGTTRRTDPATGEERVWRGDSLEDIADFYRGQLAALGATGEEGSGEDSWSFTGSYSGGKIEIQVTPNGDGYRISCTIDQPDWPGAE